MYRFCYRLAFIPPCGSEALVEICTLWRNFQSILGVQKKKATSQLSPCKLVQA